MEIPRIEINVNQLWQHKISLQNPFNKDLIIKNLNIFNLSETHNILHLTKNMIILFTEYK